MRIKNKKLTQSSRLWLQRQLTDPYVKRAQKDGYRSRAAYKLLEIQEKHKLIKPGMSVVDLGAAPGGWSQILSHIIGAKGHIIALDLLDMPPIPHVTFYQKDFIQSIDMLKQMFPEGLDCVLSDMSPSTCGVSKVDHIRIMALLEEVFLFAQEILSPGGHFLAKIFKGGTEQELLKRIRLCFEKVIHIKPKASRQESSEMYILGIKRKRLGQS